MRGSSSLLGRSARQWELQDAIGLSGSQYDDWRRVETARMLATARTASDEEARRQSENHVVRVNLSVALDVARRYYGRGIAEDDLDQVACLALVKAARRFDPTAGGDGDFLSFAVPTIRGEIRRYFRDAGWAVRPPRSVQEVQVKLIRGEAALSQELGRRPRANELAHYLGVPLRVVLEAQGAQGCFAPDSIDAATSDSDEEGSQYGDRLGHLDPAFDSIEARMSVDPLLGSLKPRDRLIVELRYYEERTQAQIGELVGISQEQVSRVLSRVLRQLRLSLAA